MIEAIAPAPAEPRRVRAPLMLGLIAVPIVFVWFLFLPGFAWSLRRVALVYAFLPVLLAAMFVILTALAMAMRQAVGALG